jgi:putative ABC transport system substrate-binding protein
MVYREAEGRTGRLPELAAELVAQKPDVLVTVWGTAAAIAAKRASDTVPIVAIAVGDLLTAGLVHGLARPGGNLTGLSTLALERERIVKFAADNRMPAIYSQEEFVRAGGLISYGVDLGSIYARAATYVDKIIKGEQPADLPVEQPTTFRLVINLKTAKALSLDVPPMLLARADEVIE